MEKMSFGALKALKGVGKILLGFEDAPSWAMPLFAAGAVAPVVGYSFDRYNEEKKQKEKARNLAYQAQLQNLAQQELPIKLADLNELGMMLRHAKEHSRKDEKGSLLQGLDSEPKDELDLEEQEESVQPEGPQGPSYSTIGGGLGRGPG